ncbi:MAG: mismatch repair protein, partial [Gammaproteobacteria bacterium]
VSALDEYTQRLSAREAEAQRLQKLHGRLGSIRLSLALITVVLAWWAFLRHAVSPWWLMVPIGGFGVTVLYHSSVRNARARVERAVAFYRRGLARIEDRWMGQGQSGDRFSTPHHVYAADLDLFGTGSLFELLATARTRMGEDALARWLLGPSPLEQVRERHASVADLRNRVDFREELAVLGEDVSVGVRPEALLAWTEGQDSPGRHWIQWVALLVPALFVATAVVWSIWGFATPLLLVLLAAVGTKYALRTWLGEMLSGTEVAFENLRLFSQLLLRVEREPFSAPSLQERVRRLRSHSLSASESIARLSRIVEFMEARRNPILSVLDVPLMYSVNAALAAELWRRAHGKAVREWVDALGEIEALASIAAYSYEHADDPFPVFVEGAASFDASDLGHPLIPAARCVRNSVGIGGKTRVVLVSGSNMSGKSTLLRSVGINVVLAMAGAPVRARRLHLTPLQVGASIRINDSLHEGSSRFYAEITRLRQLHDLQQGTLPLLFLLDELLQGTNSSDRRIGAQGVVRAFVKGHAIGLISTHDLALTDIGGLEEGALHNVHFQDEILDGEMKFDFQLREGVVTRSNGLELMRAIGLEV